MKYYLEVDTISGLDPAPYRFGVIDEYNPAPEGSKTFKTKAELDKAISKVDDSKKGSLPVFNQKDFDKIEKEIEKELKAELKTNNGKKK